MTRSAQRPVRVVHVIGSLDRGGAEMVALDLCRSIPADRVRQVFVCVSGRRGSLAALFEEAGAEVRVHGRGAFRAWLGLTRDLRRDPPDVVQSHVGLASALFLLPGLVLRIPRRIARMHSEGDGRADTRRRLAYRAGARRLLPIVATDVLAVSSGALAFSGATARRQRRARYAVLPNGVDLDRFRGPSRRADGKIVVLHVGRPSPAKNRAFLPPLASALVRRTPSELWVVGGGTDEDMPGVHPGIVDHGQRTDVPDLLRRADVLVLPSVREGLPTVALEALASGVPVVASDIGAVTSLAAQLAGIEVVSLDASAEEWARVVVEAARLPAAQRRELCSSVGRSPFNLRTNVEHWQDAWGVDR